MATAKQSAVVMTAANDVRRNASAAYRAAVPELKTDNFGEWSNSLCTNGNAYNEFYAGINKNIFMNVLYEDIFENKLAPLKKGFISNGAGVREYAVGEVDVLPYDVTDVEKQELKRYMQEMYEAVYQVNMARKYPTTLGRVQFRESLESMDAVYRAIEVLRDNVRKWEQIDEMTLMIALIQTNIVHGRWAVRPVDMSDYNNLFIELQALSGDMEEPRREWTPFGVANSSPQSRQIVIMTNRTKATLGVGVKAGAFNLDQLWLPGRQFTVSTLAKPYYEDRLNQLREINSDIPVFDEAALSVLGNVVAVIMDERVLQIWDYIYETWEKELASTMEINYFLHVWQIFATSPFWPVVVLVDSKANTALPETITGEIVSKSITAQGSRMHISLGVDGAALVGGNAQLQSTDELVAAGVYAQRTGDVVLTANAAGGALVAQLNGVTYTAGESITPASNVGESFTFTKAG